MTADRDRLAADLMSHRWFAGPRSAHSEHRFDAQCAICGNNVEAIAEAVIAAGWRPPARIIETCDDLEALPVGTFVDDDSGTVWRRGEVAWHACGRTPDTPIRIVLPAIVVRTPENGDTQ